MTEIINNLLKKENTFIHSLCVDKKFNEVLYLRLINDIAHSIQISNSEFKREVTDNFSLFLELQRCLYRVISSHYDKSDLLVLNLSEFKINEELDIYDMFDIANDISLKLIKLTSHYTQNF